MHVLIRVSSITALGYFNCAGDSQFFHLVIFHPQNGWKITSKTPSGFSKVCSIHRKQPPAKVAPSSFVWALRMDCTKRVEPSDNKTTVVLFAIMVPSLFRGLEGTSYLVVQIEISFAYV